MVKLKDTGALVGHGTSELAQTLKLLGNRRENSVRPEFYEQGQRSHVGSPRTVEN